MRQVLLPLAILALCFSTAANAEDSTARDLYSDTWVATDALGRTMPAFAEVGPVKKDQRRVVGIFYIAWHSDTSGKLKSPYTADVTKVLAADPKARLDAKHPLWTEGSYHWGEPEAGLLPEQGRVCHSQGHVHARRRGRGCAGHGCYQCGAVLGRVGCRSSR